MPRKTPRSRPEIAPENWSQSSTTTRLRQSVTVQPEPADEEVSPLPEPTMPPTLLLPESVSFAQLERMPAEDSPAMPPT